MSQHTFCSNYSPWIAIKIKSNYGNSGEKKSTDVVLIKPIRPLWYPHVGPSISLQPTHPSICSARCKNTSWLMWMNESFTFYSILAVRFVIHADSLSQVDHVHNKLSVRMLTLGSSYAMHCIIITWNLTSVKVVVYILCYLAKPATACACLATWHTSFPFQTQYTHMWRPCSVFFPLICFYSVDLYFLLCSLFDQPHYTKPILLWC